MKSLEEMIKRYRKTANDCMKTIRELSTSGAKSPAMVEVKEASEQIALWLEELQQFRMMIEELTEYIDGRREGASDELLYILDGIEDHMTILSHITTF